MMPMVNFLTNHTPFLYLTQSLWRDEAFAVLLSEPSLSGIVRLTIQDFNPPLYYFILHFWMKFFGQGEVAIRMLSFIFHLLLVYVVYRFGKFLKFSKRTNYFLILITFLNPMLIYYAFEARMYSLLVLLATTSMYFFLTKNWALYILASALGLWTQPFMVFILLSQGFYLLVTKTLTRKYLLAFAAILLLFSPWLPAIFFQFSRSGPMWMWPINWTTVTTILGDVFTAYEGTPGGLWNKMAILSLAIFLLALWVFKKLLTKNEKLLSRSYQLILIWLFLPVIVVLAISYFKPIYVNRYIIFVTVAEILSIAIAVSLVKNRLLRQLIAWGFLIFTIGFNLWFPPLHKKLDLRSTLAEINREAGPQDWILAQTPLTFFEATYYTANRSRVLLYNPNRSAVPFYAGASIITERKMVSNFPQYPSRAFLIHDDGTYDVVSQKYQR